MRRYYYARDDYYGSETSRGFSNTKMFFRFPSKKERDNFVFESNRISREICTRKDVIDYHGADFYNHQEFVFSEI